MQMLRMITISLFVVGMMAAGTPTALGAEISCVRDFKMPSRKDLKEIIDEKVIENRAIKLPRDWETILNDVEPHLNIAPASGRFCRALFIQGPIERGDHEKFVALMSVHPFVSDVYLLSPGGSLADGIAIGKEIRTRLIETHAPHRLYNGIVLFNPYGWSPPESSAGGTPLDLSGLTPLHASGPSGGRRLTDDDLFGDGRRLLTDEEFLGGGGRLLTDDDVFGTPKAAPIRDDSVLSFDDVPPAARPPSDLCRKAGPFDDLIPAERRGRPCLCASSCFLIWAGGIDRNGNMLGLHRPSYEEAWFGALPPGEASRRYADLMRVTEQYLEDMEVEKLIAEKMISTPKETIFIVASNRAYSQMIEGHTPSIKEWISANCITLTEDEERDIWKSGLPAGYAQYLYHKSSDAENCVTVQLFAARLDLISQVSK